MIGKLLLIPLFKSHLEELVWHKLRANFPQTTYEPDKFKYTQPEQGRTYTPDFKLGNNLYIETKGRLDLDTRKKMVWFKNDNQDIRIIFLFMNSSNTITKKSKTTYAQWAESEGFEWLDFRKDWLGGLTILLGDK